jgi:hypothetical protein
MNVPVMLLGSDSKEAAANALSARPALARNVLPYSVVMGSFVPVLHRRSFQYSYQEVPKRDSGRDGSGAIYNSLTFEIPALP